MYDTIIIGSGPAGLSAAVYAKRAGLSFVVLEKNPVSGGQIIDTYEVDNYLGLPGENGFDLAMRFREHAEKLGAEFVNTEVVRLTCAEAGTETAAPKFLAAAKDTVYEAKTVILASGASHAKLGVPGEEALAGKGVSYCATCDGAFFRNKTAVVVGGGDVAAEDAVFLARGCEKVYVVHRRNELRAVRALQDELLSLPNVEMVWDSVVTEIRGDRQVSGVLVKNVKTGAETALAADACFIAVGILPQTALAEGLAERDANGYLVAGEDGATSTPGVFAAGDVRKKRLRQIVTAVADGANAVTAVQDFLIGKQ